MVTVESKYHCTFVSYCISIKNEFAHRQLCMLFSEAGTIQEKLQTMCDALYSPLGHHSCIAAFVFGPALHQIQKRQGLLTSVSIHPFTRSSVTHRPEKKKLLSGLIQPQLMPDGQVKVDMGPPILIAADVPTTLGATQVVPFSSDVADVKTGLDRRVAGFTKP